MILPQAAVASPASLSIPGSARVSSGKGSVTSGVEFGTLLQSTVARTSPATAPSSPPVPSSAASAPNAGDGDALSTAEQNQGSAVSPSTISGQQSTISFFLAFGGMAPLQTASANVTATDSISSDTNSGAGEQSSMSETDAQSAEPAGPAEQSQLASLPAQVVSATAAAPIFKKVSATALVCNSGTPIPSLQLASISDLSSIPVQSTVAESAPKGTSAATATNGLPLTPVAADGSIQSMAISGAAIKTSATHPVFALDIRANAEAQQQSPNEQPLGNSPANSTPGVNASQAMQQNLALANPAAAAANLQVGNPRLPLTAASGQYAQAQQANDVNSTPVAPTSEPGDASDTLGEQTGADLPAVTGSAISVRTNELPLDSDPKSGSTQTSDRQPMAPILETAVTPPSNSSDNPTSASAAPHSGADYTHADEGLNAHGGAPVTDIRLQLDGTANQQVSVRLVQQADGLRVTLRSNDPELTQALQERVPELTMRLDQHHYQTEVLMPERADAQHFAQPNSNTNSQQDLSGRNQSSSGQGNQGNKQNQQRKQQSWDEDFATLLA